MQLQSMRDIKCIMFQGHGLFINLDWKEMNIHFTPMEENCEPI